MQANKTEAGSADKSGQAFEGFIDKREVGRRLGLAPRTVDDWMRRGWLPYYKPDRTVRFKWSEIERHLEQTCRVCRDGSDVLRD